MATTFYLHRITAVVPVGRRDALVAWMVANLGADWAGAFSSPLVPAGGADDAGPTHYWASFACTNEQAKLLMVRITGQTSIAQPGMWDAWTRSQKKVWLAGVRGSIRAAIGADIVGSDNDGVWNDPATALTALGLKVRAVAIVDDGRAVTLDIKPAAPSEQV